MPPTRSMPPAKAVKTERTHEENQERAYIAASRRSDRSLEARVESARRASEIHKRRTGRSLRVTEQDVQNEEMYEEEDDDLPLQYRRLTAHLQTGSADFNRRLSAYLTNHVAMRSALEQSIHNSYAQQFPNAPQYQNQNMFPSPMLAHQQQQQHMMQPPHSPGMYRQQPYPSPQQTGFSIAHQRSNSVAVPPTISGSTSPDQRRSMSTSGTSSEGHSTNTSQNNASSETSTPSSTTQHQKPSFPAGTFSQSPHMNNNNQPFALPSYDMGAFGHSQFPAFTTQLPAETQGFLGSTLDPNDPLTNMMMAGGVAGNFWNFNGGGVLGMSGMGGSPYAAAKAVQTQQPQQQHAPSLAGLNSTLAPAELPLDIPSKTKVVSPVIKNAVLPVVEAPEEEEVAALPNEELFFENAMMGKDGITPGLNGDSWDSWINDASWDVAPTSSQ